MWLCKVLESLYAFCAAHLSVKCAFFYAAHQRKDEPCLLLWPVAARGAGCEGLLCPFSGRGGRGHNRRLLGLALLPSSLQDNP